MDRERKYLIILKFNVVKENLNKFSINLDRLRVVNPLTPLTRKQPILNLFVRVIIVVIVIDRIPAWPAFSEFPSRLTHIYILTHHKIYSSTDN